MVLNHTCYKLHKDFSSSESINDQTEYALHITCNHVRKLFSHLSLYQTHFTPKIASKVIYLMYGIVL